MRGRFQAVASSRSYTYRDQRQTGAGTGSPEWGQPPITGEAAPSLSVVDSMVSSGITTRIVIWPVSFHDAASVTIHGNRLLSGRPSGGSYSRTIDVPRITKNLEGATARKANHILGRSGRPSWHPESFDHCVRNGFERRGIIGYIEANPVTAGLVAREQGWPWSSASRWRRA